MVCYQIATGHHVRHLDDFQHACGKSRSHAEITVVKSDAIRWMQP